ncbi:phenylalanine--tRNA ligase subunit beta [Ghiorsea bivora]|uniref:phenylalanine--tRNA ligase subunit beta n=1 Tax=Ghiorsea bivora TaxID=1485545 RepID=UPI00056F5291|nr:phenylalanine--tRNA ligase subunit beta [Ghiorsea bivora]
MKIPFSWLKEHCPIEKTPQDVADDLVRLGHEVEGIETPRAGVKGVRVGHIVEMKPHPDADKLKLLKIDLGDVDHLAIVCGASNMVEGDKVPVATVGTSLPNGLKIKKGKIRGEVSFGMCCSEAELGLAEDADGLLILPKDAPVGEEVGEYLELEEAVLDLDITPNRGDCMSLRGIARDLAADYALPLIEPGDEVVTTDDSVVAPTVAVTASEDCTLYTACRIEGVKVVDSPEWLQTRLIAAGLRPINGVVDVINYTMLDLGQPMHAFDADTLDGSITVRLAKAGETFTSLEGKEVSLQAEDLVIADDAHVIALAGIMGSEPTGVTEKTSNIILESAAFRPARISITRRTCGLVSDSSMRFERGVDPAMIAVAMDQVAQMIVSLFGGQVSKTTAVGDADSLIKDTQIKVNMQRIESRLGIEVPKTADAVLERMGFGIEHDGDILNFSVPSHRPDVRLAEDISEEYARVIGFDNIPAVLPPLTTIQPSKVDTGIADAVRLGFVQVINYAFISKDEQRLFVPVDDKDLILPNPISEAMSVMRRSMFPSLLNTAKYNMNRQQTGVALVEQGRIYTGPLDEHTETNMLAWLMTGDVQQDTWYAKSRKADFFDLKGAIESWLQGRGLTARFMADDDVQGLQAGQTAKIFIGKSVAGYVGKVDGDLAGGFDLSDDVFVASINLDVLHTGKKAKFQPIPEFPSIERDLVFLFDKGVTSDVILQTVRKACGQQLVDASIFDLYDGQGVPEGKVSLGIRFVLQDAKRTLTQEDSDKVMQAVIDAMATKFKAELRG